ncbi:MAG TPA: GNAT family N-acetyltransferase [Actinomycetota bacterium]|nr:GNAT family N-acetyltransferase [Actinomycetota bacterium]
MSESSNAQITVRRMTSADLVRVVDLLARAFSDDPVLNFIVRADHRRAERIRRIMEVSVRKLTFPFGETYVTSGYEGAALWNPPGQRPHGWRTDLRLLPVYLRLAGLRGLPRIAATDRLLEEKHLRGPHYYLLAVGVEPYSQGRGIGTRLLSPVLERCDRDGIPAYLETGTERNLPLYLRLGFSLAEQIVLPRGGPPLWLMRREPH